MTTSGILNEMPDPEFRHAYAADQTRMRIAFLVRALRSQPEYAMTQREFADAMGTTQSAVSRLEDPDYGNLRVSTLLNAAAALDLPLFIDFPEWPKWLAEMDDFSKESFWRQRFDHNECVDGLEMLAAGVLTAGVTLHAAAAVSLQHLAAISQTVATDSFNAFEVLDGCIPTVTFTTEEGSPA